MRLSLPNLNMKTYAVAFCVLWVLVVGKTTFAKSFIFDKVGDGSNLDFKKNEDLSKQDLNFRPSSYKHKKRSPYGLVYNQGKPIGILEPISQSFEYSPRDGGGAYRRSQWFPAKRDTGVDEAGGLHSNNYASVLAKFKVNNKVKQRPYQDFLYSQQVKREAPESGEEKIDGIEENLKDVMSDMGLVEKNKDEVKKREIYYEDEDLENGLNKIGLTKESRDKKENCPGKTKVKSKPGKRQKTEHKKMAKKKLADENGDEEDTKRSVNRKSAYSGNVKTNVANYQNEGEAYIRSKRQEKENEDSDIMKGLEQSGDLTVSGNKSPLVAVASAEENKSQEKRDKEELEYEKRLERNIQAKINAIKEEVKREIGKLRNEDEKLQRKKREIANTLLDEETSVLDPDLNIDQKLEPYVRKRRDAIEESQKKRDTIEESTKNQDDKPLKETRDSINEIANGKIIEKRSEINAELETDLNLTKNITKRNQEEDTEKSNDQSSEDVVKRSDADLSTGKTIIDLDDTNEKNEETAAVNDENYAENKRGTRRTKTRNADAIDDTVEDENLSQRSIDGQETEDDATKCNSGNPPLDVDRNARKLFDKEDNIGRLERNTKKLLDEDSNIYRQNRRRRGTFYRRRKRDDDPEFVGYRADNDGEIDDEGDEMDDDGFNDQTSNFLDKRQAADYDQEDDEDEMDEDYPSLADRVKRSSLDDADEAYDSFLFYPTRKKRGDFEQRLASHGGETTLKHLAAVRERNAKAMEKNYRRKRLERLNDMHSRKQDMAELSESDIFGGLPQSYEGELSRFKRVKRQM